MNNSDDTKEKIECEKHLWQTFSSEIVDDDEIQDDDGNWIWFNIYECQQVCVHCGEKGKYHHSLRD